jgi:hypothetical protein
MCNCLMLRSAGEASAMVNNVDSARITEPNPTLKEGIMRSRSLTIPEIGFIAATRAAAGAGVALLLAGKMRRATRKRVGITLLTVGAVSTIPIIAGVFWKTKAATELHPSA